ncbi:MAG: AAA family ATPase [Xanthomonadales bacterium]|nr:AAA family ATPase [Xanthomonadales bacterium]
MINRKITNNIVEGLNNFRVVLLNGPRQSGKTTLVKKIADDVGMEYVTLDDPEKLELAINDPKNFLEFYGASPIAIDEIQFAPQLIPYIKIKVEKKKRILTKDIFY